MPTPFEIAPQGMRCGACVGRVSRALETIEGVNNIAVNLATGRARMELSAPASERHVLEALQQAGYPGEPVASAPNHSEEAPALGRNALIAAALTLPVFVLEMGGHVLPAFHHWLHGAGLQMAARVLSFALITLVLLWPGRVFYRHGIPALLRATPDMNSLVALGTLAAWGYSTVVVFAPGLVPADARHVYFEAAGVIVTLILIGRMLEAQAKGKAGAAIARLVGLQPDEALRLASVESDTPEPCQVGQVKAGDLLLIRPGARVPVDGVVQRGESYVDEAMLTGEPLAQHKKTGTPLTGGTINTGKGALVMEATHVGQNTTLARITRMVEEAQSARLPVQALVDRITLWFVPAILALSLITFFAWLALGGGGLSQAVSAAVAVLIIACPCAMGLAVPVSIVVATGRAAEMGILFRKGDALQRLNDVGLVAFDKTGTLTQGAPRVTALWSAEGDEQGLLAVSAGLEQVSDHPLAEAVRALAGERAITPEEMSNHRETAGEGVTALLGGEQVAIGTQALMERLGIAMPGPENAPPAHASIAYVSRGRALLGWIALTDPPRPEARTAIAALTAAGVRSALLSGDRAAAVDHMAGELGIPNAHSALRPEEKATRLAELRQTFETPVAFVGDGINDAPALASSDVGIAMGTGTDVAIETGDVVLLSPNPTLVSRAIVLSRATLRNIWQNLFWAFGYNVALIPIAAGLLVPFGGPALSPSLAALAMTLSSLFVLANALRLRKPGAADLAEGGMA